MTCFLTPVDILDTAQFLKTRPQKLPEMMALKKSRRLNLGDWITLHFENRTTLWWQIQEMLRVEQGGNAQIIDELNAYNPLIPQGQELVATMMIEIDDPYLRRQKLYEFSHIEEQIAFRFAGHTLLSQPEKDVERTRSDGKTSAVHFLRWPFTEEQIKDFKKPGQDIILEISHPKYNTKTILSEVSRQNLACDFDIR